MVKRVGQYELRGKIGKGTFGSVYLGWHVPSKNQVAIKMINRKDLKTEQQHRLDQEIICQRAVSSPYIVKLIDVQKTDNNIYLILELCEGGDLAQFIQKHGPVTEDVARRWMQQLAKAFQIIRSKNIIHRDLKLQNILLTEESLTADVKLAEFGLSRFLEDSLAESWLGTPLYMAPEVFSASPGYDSKADIWSLGIAFYEMLVGKGPFNARRRHEIPQAQKNLNPLPPHLSEMCRDMASRMLAYDPQNRLSFEEFFAHPFLSEEADELPQLSQGDSMKESLLSDDFVILDQEESDEEFQAQPQPLNLEEVNHIVEGQVETAQYITKLAERFEKNKEGIAAFSIYVKACLIYQHLLEYMEELIAKHNLTQAEHSSFFNTFKDQQRLFTDCLVKIDGLSAQVDDLTTSKDLSKLNSTYSVGTEGLANSLIHQYTIKLCREASYDEYIQNYTASKDKYKEAVVLLEYVCKPKTGGDQWNAVESFRTETIRRLDTVSNKLVNK